MNLLPHEKNRIYLAHHYIPIWIFQTYSQNSTQEKSTDSDKALKLFHSCRTGIEQIAYSTLSLHNYQNYLIFFSREGNEMKFTTTRLVPVVGTKLSFEQDPNSTFNLELKDQFNYIFRLIESRLSQLAILQQTPAYDKTAWYVFDELNNIWKKHRVAVHCSECGRLYWEPLNTNPQSRKLCPEDCPSHPEESIINCYDEYCFGRFYKWSRIYDDVFDFEPTIEETVRPNRSMNLLCILTPIKKEYLNKLWEEIDKILENQFKLDLPNTEIVKALRKMHFVYEKKLKELL